MVNKTELFSGGVYTDDKTVVYFISQFLNFCGFLIISD